MPDLTRLDDLKVLECALQDRLHAHLGRVVPFQVQCVFKDGVLWVLAQHSTEVVVDTQETFRILEKALQAEQPGAQLPVKLYLRKSGDKQPYSTENFTIYPSVKERIPREAAPAIDETELKVSESDTLSGAEFDAVMPPSVIHTDFGPPIPAAPAVEQEEVDRAKEILDRLALDDSGVPGPPPVSATPMPVALEDTLVDEATIEQDNGGFFTPTTGASNSDLSRAEEAEAFANDIQSSFAYTEGKPAGSPLKKWLIGGGVGLLALGGGYTLSRPCVLGTCPQIATSQSLAEKSLATLNRQSTGKEILTAQAEMHQSVEQLKTVPVWSTSYGQAQKELKTYSRHAELLDIAVEGMKKAARASDKTSKQPVSQVTWKESQKLWVEAIANLQKIPADSKIYPLAQQKLQEYQQKLESVNQNITSEVNADKSLASARAIGTSNTAKQAQAKTLEEWQVAQKEWQNFEKSIAEIPADTTAHPVGQQLLKDYQPQITAVRTKLDQEKVHGETVTKAVAAAKTATQLRQDKKLQESLGSWNTAISTLQNIPQDSSYQPKATALMEEYSKGMKQVELAVVNDQKKTQADASLKKICDGKPQVCSYKIDGSTITVKLLPDYAKIVRQTATDATKQDDNNAKVGLIRHVSSLGDALESVSNSSGLALQLYADDGKLLQKYSPRKP
jgi:hypothetical protein